ncbi:MAG: hypothetical protein R3F19_12725 [Verrucomicrobiales bacterium]
MAERAQLLASFDNNPSSTQKETNRVLLVQWAQTDGAAAADWLKNSYLRSDNDRNRQWTRELGDALYDVLATWAHKNPESAVAWYRENRDLFDEWFGFDALRCFSVRALASLPSLMGKSFSDVYDSTIAEDLAMPDHTAEEFAEAFKAFAQAKISWNGPSIQQTLAERWVELDSAAATRWAAEQPPSDYRDAVLEQVRKRRMATAEDPLIAANELLADQSILPRSELIESIIKLWPEGHLLGASIWLGNQQDYQKSSAAIEKLADRAVRTDPLGAFSWLDSIADVTQREVAYGNVFDHWHAADPQEAERFFLEQLNVWPTSRIRVMHELIVSQVHSPNDW